MSKIGMCSALVLCAGLSAQTAIAENDGFDRTDYSDLDTWLCHPDKPDDACEIDLTATAILADGTTETVPFEAATDPAYDCVYYYPTVSFDVTPNSDLEPGVEEFNVIANQFARFGSACRLFAPLYRQATLVSIRQRVTTGSSEENLEMRYADILDSWNHYLENHNDGRGIVLIGHSQGAGMILELLRNDVLGTDVEDQLISVMPIGMPAHTDEDGTFEGMPMCSASDEIGCIINFMSFKADAEPPKTSFFGRANADGDRAMCVNPIDLNGETELQAFMPRLSLGQFTANDYGAKVGTPFVTLPGFIKAECRTNGTHDWLAIETISDETDVRAGKLGGELVIAGEVQEDWGLHIVDMNIAIGNLVTIADQQASAWLAENEG